MPRKLFHSLRGKYIYLVLLCLVLNMASVYSQNNYRISGKVLDENGEPLRGVTILLRESQSKALSDEIGNYSITVPSLDGVLVFTYVGFQPKEVGINGNTLLNVTLQVAETGLGEVVVIGYGTQKKVNLTGSVSTISSQDLSIRQVGQASAALQGLAPGVTVTQSSGRPGADDGVIRVRGIGTLNDANPLVIIDGIEGDLNSLDPNLIESVSVLKDAASSSIYGSRAANGVVLVTTKRGRGGNLTFNYNSYVGFQKPTNQPKMINAVEHMELLNIANTNVGLSKPFSDDLITRYKVDGPSNRDLYPDTDWGKEVLTGSGLMQNHFFTINGGGEKVRFLTSVGFLEQEGLFELSKFNKYIVRNNVDLRFSKKLSMKFDLQGVISKTIDAGVGSTAIFFAIRRNPANLQGVFSNGLWGEGYNGNNPIARSTDAGGRRMTRRPTAIANVSINYKPFEWLTADLTAAPRYEVENADLFQKSITTYKADGSIAFVVPQRSTLTRSNSESFFNTYRLTLNAQKDFHNHHINILVGSSREDRNTDIFTASREEFLLPQYAVLNAGSQSFVQNSGYAYEWALQSVFGRINYDFRQKYFLEINGRYDGSSRFAPGYKYGFFPSFSAGWRFTEEKFMDGLKSTISEGKFRASWGKLGNQNIGNYPFTSTISLGAYGMGGQVANFAALNTMANPSISWESSSMTNLGIDLVLFSNFTLSGDYYTKRTSGILYDLDIPLTIGLNKPFQNAGIVDNKGWEIALGYRKQIGDFQFRVNANVSDVKNTVVDLKGVNRTGRTVSREGSSINSLYGYEAIGLFQTDDEALKHATQYGAVKAGDIKYKDQNEDGVINDKDFIIIGSTIPRYTYGLNVNGSYKSIDLAVFLQGVGKANGYIEQEGGMPFYLGGTLQEIHKDYWTPQNPNAKFPRLAFNSANNIVNSSFWMRDASYIRIKNVQIGYTLPKRLTTKIGISNLKVYLNGQNLFTIDNFWKGYDVETPVGDGTSYPQLKMVSFGLNVNF